MGIACKSYHCHKTVVAGVVGDVHPPVSSLGQDAPLTKEWRAMYGGKLNYALVCGALLVAGFVARPAAALEWDLDGSSSGSELQFDAVGSSNTQDIWARGYYSSNTDGTGRFRTGSVQNWDGGIGVFANDDSGSPQHAIDNNGKDNFLLIEFDNPNYLLTAFKIGWYSTDRDVEVWVGGADLGPDFSLNKYDVALCGGYCDYQDLQNLGFTKVTVFQNVVVNSWTAVNTDVTGRYAIFAGEYGEYDDYFKLSGIKGEVIEVPEPATLAMMGTGLLAVGGILRRRRRKAPTAS